MRQSVIMVGTPMKIRMMAGAKVQPISSSVCPCTGLGLGVPGRSLKRIIATTNAPSTTTKTTMAHQKIPRMRESISRATSDWGNRDDWGKSPPHAAANDEMASAANM